MSSLFAEMTTEKLHAMRRHLDNAIASSRACSIDLIERRDAICFTLRARGQAL
jgi:hypothetical protein